MKLLRNLIHVENCTPTKVGSIHLPPNLNEIGFDATRLFRVLDVGPGKTTKRGVPVPIECAPGDRVILYSHKSGPVKLDDGTYLITDDQILAVLPKNTAVISTEEPWKATGSAM